MKSPIYQSLESLLLIKNPSVRFQQIREREAKELLEQQQSLQVSQQTIIEKPRTSSSVKSTSSIMRFEALTSLCIYFFRSATYITTKRLTLIDSFFILFFVLNKLSTKKRKKPYSVFF